MPEEFTNITMKRSEITINNVATKGKLNTKHPIIRNIRIIKSSYHIYMMIEPSQLP